MTLLHYWIQIKDLTLASIKSRYRKTWAGFLWVIMNPILQFGVQCLVFKNFLKLDVKDYYLFLLGGLLPWIFFTSTLSMGIPTFVSYSNLLKSLKVNPMVIICSQILDNFLNFVASLLIIFMPFYFLADKAPENLLLIPLAVLPLLIGTSAITVSLATLNVFYRDVNFVIGFILSLLFFLTPIFYPRELVPLEWQWMIDYNPVVHFIAPFRQLLYHNDLNAFFQSTLLSLGIAVGFTLLAVLIWKRKINGFYRKL